jgi:alpha-aminoadipic semialdehyde synthase
MMAVDILPASIPLDSSRHFSEVLCPYLTTLIQEYRGERVVPEYGRALSRATVARNGELVGKHQWLAESVTAWRENASIHPGESPGRISYDNASIEWTFERNSSPAIKLKKKVLMLGSGMVAGPAVNEISKRSDVELLVGLCDVPILCTRVLTSSGVMQPAIH